MEEKSNVRTYLFNINIWVAIPTSTLLKEGYSYKLTLN